MSHKQEEELAKLFEEEIFYDGFREKLYLAFWLWLSTSQSEQRRANVIPIAIRILQKANRVASSKVGSKTLVPEFVPKKIFKEMAEIQDRMKELSK